MKIAVYTFISGNYDSLKSFNKGFSEDADFFYLTDNPQETPEGSGKYKTMIIPIMKGYERYTSRYCKMFPNLFFPDYDYTIWMDGSTSLQVNPKALIEKYLSSHEIAAFKYPDEDCIYIHADKCVAVGRYSESVIAPHMAFYREIGFPEHAGLCEIRVILRKNTDQVRILNELWFETFKRWLTCDQLCFNYCLWKLDMKYETIEWGSPEFNTGTHNFYNPPIYVRQ
jgi:hypothetical protein